MIGALWRPDHCCGSVPVRGPMIPLGAIAPNEHGFSLIEVIVALAIVAFGLANFSQAISTSVRAAQRTRLQAIALADIQSHLNSLGVDGVVEVGRSTGRYRDGLPWRLDVSALTEQAFAPASGEANLAPAFSAGQIRCYWVVLEAFNSSGSPLVKLQTAKLVKPLP